MRQIVGNGEPWKSTTAGERLLFLILKHHKVWSVLEGALATGPSLLCRRQHDFADFFVGASITHLVQRIVKTAVALRRVHERRDEQIRALRDQLVNTIGFAISEYDADIDVLLNEAIACAENADRSKVAKGLAKSVLRADSGSAVVRCYSCDRVLNVQGDNGTMLKSTCDHVWPASMGGDTHLDNLLPACQGCNRDKAYVAVWQMAWVQVEVYPAGSDDARKSVSRRTKMALHMRAAVEFACDNGTSLRDAYLAIGPRDMFVTRCDEDDTLDFFNMRVHDPIRTNVGWMPR